MIMIAGVDEAGRGPLAGPVVAAAVILNPEYLIEGLADSKKLSEKKRERLFEEIVQHSLSFAIGHATVIEIDKINILQASLLAMQRAVHALDIPHSTEINLGWLTGMSLCDRLIWSYDNESAGVMQSDLA